MQRNNINKLIAICLDIAEHVDEKGEKNDFTLADDLGIGFRALSRCLRSGVKAVIDLQASYHSAQEKSHTCRDRRKGCAGLS